MPAVDLPLILEQGANLDRTFTVLQANDSPRDLTNYTARMQIRGGPGATGSPLVSLTTGSGITLGGVTGTVRIQMTAAETAALSFYRGVWDLEIVSAGGVVERVLAGDCLLSREVTK